MILQKPPASSSTRNRLGPRADRLLVAYGIDEQTGSTLNTLGLAVDYNTSVQLPHGVTSVKYEGEILDLSDVADSTRWFDSSEGPYLYLKSNLAGTTQQYVRVLNNDTGSDIISLRGTMMFRFSFQNRNPDNAQPLFNSGTSAAVKGNRLIVFLDNVTGQLRVYLSESGLGADFQTRLKFDELVIGQIYTLIVTWGEAGFNAWLDGVEADLIRLPGPIEEGDPDFIDSRASGGRLTNTFWSVEDSENIRIGRNNASRYADINLYTFCWWDVQLKQVEREEIFCDAYVNFRPRALDYSGSGSSKLFRTNVNPIPVRPTLNTDSIGTDRDEITFSVVTSKNLGSTVFMRINYGTDPNLQNPTVSNIVSETVQNKQMNLIIGGLSHATTYYYVAEYSVDGTDWFAFPGGKGKFKTQKRVDVDFDYGFFTDDHLCNNKEGGPPLDSLDLGYGGDILHNIIINWNTSFHGHKWFLAWRSMYDIYVNQDVDFIIIGGDYYYGDNQALYDGDTDASGNPEKLAETYRNWCNMLFKSGVCYFVQGNHENEAGYFQREDAAVQTFTTQMRCTVARKKFFPNPTNDTYPQGGEYETPHNDELDWIPDSGNDWIPDIDTQSSTSGDNLTPGKTQVSYNQTYRDEFILGITDEDPYSSTVDPFALNRSPLENYFGWTWGNTLFAVLDVYRYSEPGDPLNSGGDHDRDGPVWTYGTVQKNWLNTILANSKEQSKFVFAHQLNGGEAIATGGIRGGGVRWYGRGSGALINNTIGVDGFNSYNTGTDQLVENPEEIEIHNLLKQYRVTALVKGHDHKFCHVINDEMNYITVSSPSAPSQWEKSGMRNSYGHTEDQDNPITSAVNLGIKVTTNTRGYCIFRRSENSWKCINRLCAMTPYDIDSLAVQDYTNVRFGGTIITPASSGPGWAGPTYIPDSSDQIVLSETPWDIYTICTLSDGVFSGAELNAGIWDESVGVVDSANLYRQQGDNWEEFYENGVITLDSSIIDPFSAGEELHVLHVPMTTHTQTILNSVNEDQIPVSIHNINPDNVIFVYNINVAGSKEVAEYYREKRNLPVDNLLGLDMPVPNPPSSCETPISKLVFESTILEPIRSAITTIPDSQLGASGSGFSCSTIILGYGTPLSYIEDDGQTIAIASRLHRINHTYEAKKPNHTYDRRDFKFYDTVDSQQVCITAIIDGPTVAAVKALIDRGVVVSNQSVVTGKILVDPYGLRFSEEDTDYENDILDFVQNGAPNLGSTIDQTVEIDSEDPYVEPTVAFFRGESFYWGWFEPTFSKNLFFNQSEKRVFLYNADNDSACQIHFLQNGSPFQVDGSDPWCNLAINVDPGYAACAGSVDAPGSDAYLRPRPFFNALQQGASMGEAFLFSSPFVNWKTVLIGDPLTTVIFPADVPPDDDPNDASLPNAEVIKLIKEQLEESLAWGSRQARFTQWIRERNVESLNLGEELELLYAAAKWENRKSIQVHNDLLNRSTQSFVAYVLATTGITFPEWLTREQNKTTILFNNLLAQLGAGAVQDEDTDNLVYTEGHWDYDFVYTHNRQTFENLNFELQLSVDKNFTQLVIDVATASSILGWQYEAEPYVFVQLASSGFPSNFSGRRLKFTSSTQHFLTGTDVFYVRWRAIEADGVTPVNNWQVDSKVLIIKR